MEGLQLRTEMEGLNLRTEMEGLNLRTEMVYGKDSKKVYFITIKS